MLWNLALANHPELQQAAAEVEAARGKLIQAGKYPNPRLTYEQEELGTSQAPPGTVRVQLAQEIVTAGKRRLDMARAAQGTEEASIRLASRRFSVLTRVRRAYYDYLGALDTARVNDDLVAALQQSVNITRQLVEKAKSRPLTDLLRMETLLEEARINEARSRINLQAAWRQLAAEVGVPALPPPAAVNDFAEPVPRWREEAVVQRVLAVNTELRQAMLQAEQARVEIDRARAEAVPNLQFGGGYTWNFAERERGALVSLQAALPLWDRKQGLLQEARARWTQAQAAQKGAADRLIRETTAAWASFQGARQQVERLQDEVLPRVRKSLELIRAGYQAGAAQITFADVFSAEQTLNATRLSLAGARRELWRAVADLEGLMQLDLGQDLDDRHALDPAPPDQPCLNPPSPGAP
jgi:cobalt-zinc-cadmium efflux system outer membrane protein